MIAQISGNLLGKHSSSIVIECAGIGYEIEVPIRTLQSLPQNNVQITFFTHQVIRENAHLLFGFLSVEERNTFRNLLKINGIGARTALSILSEMNVDELLEAVMIRDTKRLSNVPGVGKKTAERLLIEFQDFIKKKICRQDSTPRSEHFKDVISALLTLGYSEKEALSAVRTIPIGCSVNEGLKITLRFLDKKTHGDRKIKV